MPLPEGRWPARLVSTILRRPSQSSAADSVRGYSERPSARAKAIPMPPRSTLFEGDVSGRPPLIPVHAQRLPMRNETSSRSRSDVPIRIAQSLAPARLPRRSLPASPDPVRVQAAAAIRPRACFDLNQGRQTLGLGRPDPRFDSSPPGPSSSLRHRLRDLSVAPIVSARLMTI